MRTPTKPAKLGVPKVLEHIDPKDLIPYEKNPRQHSPEQIMQLINSINNFGWTSPALIDEENCILAGHGRQEDALALGMDEIPCIRLYGLTDAQKRAYVIADNKLTDNSDWNTPILLEELQFLQELEFDISLLGFSELELSDLLHVDEEEEELPPDLHPDYEPAPEMDEDEGTTRTSNPSFSILVDCRSEAEQTELLDEFMERDFKCRAFL
jgi:ParB family chromosome partitioning protein